MTIVLGRFFPFFLRFADGIKFSSVLQGAFLLIASIVLDDGGLLRVMCLPAIAYWCTVAIIMVRRNGSATVMDRVFLRWGFLLWIVGLVSAISLLYAATGFLPRAFRV